MSEKNENYDAAKNKIRLKKFEETLLDDKLSEQEWGMKTKPRRKIDLLDVTKIGTGVLIGGGLGLLAGVATIAVAASAAEVVIGGVITKVAGVVGGAAGLGWGVHSIDKADKRY